NYRLVFITSQPWAYVSSNVLRQYRANLLFALCNRCLQAKGLYIFLKHLSTVRPTLPMSLFAVQSVREFASSRTTEGRAPRAHDAGRVDRRPLGRRGRGCRPRAGVFPNA